jgi:hypothetical protein
MHTLPRILLLICAAALAKGADIPKGTKISERLDSPLSSRNARVGVTFDSNLASDLVFNGKIFAPAGARLRGRVTDVESATVSITLDDLETGSSRYELKTTDYTQHGKGAGRGSSPRQRAIGDTIAGTGKTPPTPDSNIELGVPLGGSGSDAVIPAQMLISFKVIKGRDLTPKPSAPKAD